MGVSPGADAWASIDARAEVSPDHRRQREEAYEPAAVGRRYREATPDRLLPAPIRAEAETVADRRDRAPSIGLVVYLAAIAVVAMATIGVFFGIAFALLRLPASPAVAQRPMREHRGVVTAVPLRGLPERAAAVIAAPAVARIAGEAPALPRGFGATKLVTATVAAPAPKPAAAAKPTVRLNPAAPAALRLPQAQLAGLVARGDAFLRAGDIASARLFYERAADGGDGQAALRAGATFDPTFLARIGLRRMRADRARALSWYRRALGLGASNAAPYLHNLETQ